MTTPDTWEWGLSQVISRYIPKYVHGEHDSEELLINAVKSFIRTLLAQEREELRKKIERMKKTHAVDCTCAACQSSSDYNSTLDEVLKLLQ